MAGKAKHEHIKVRLSQLTFRPRRAKNRRGKVLCELPPGDQRTKAAKAIRETIRDWRLAATRNNQSLEEIAGACESFGTGCGETITGRFYRSALTPVLRHLERA